METRTRTLTKATLWQFLGLVVMALIGWALTGSASLGGGLALSNAIIGFATYVIYERIWARIRWGRSA
ncbi:MAG: DUF2061 domain-containing protein [Pararhodobacter sp.]|nr:DUF2061 domain-containing protein [Pararhodobacter sp.]